MSIKRWNEKTQRWEVEASNRASAISILDPGENYESSTVEGALRELGTFKDKTDVNSKQLVSLSNKVNDHIENHPSGSGSSLPTIESSFDLDSIDSQDTINIPIYFVSPNMGEGICYVSVDGIEIKTQMIEQGDNNIQIGPLGNGKFKIEIKVKDRADLYTNKLTWTIICGGIEVKLLSNFNTFIEVGKPVSFDYEIFTNMTEQVYLNLIIDNNIYKIETSSGKHSYLLNDLGLGVHPVSYSAEVGKYKTKTYDVNINITNSETLYLSSKTKSPLTVVEGNPVVIDYTVSKISEEDFNIVFTLDGESIDGKIKSGTYTWSRNALEIGTHDFNITVKDIDRNTASLDFIINVEEDLDFEKVEVPAYKLLAWWDAGDNKNNLYSDRNIWTDKISGITGTLHNFNYSSNGWMSNLDTKEYWLECNGNAYVEIPYAPFRNNFVNGGTIDILFKTSDVGNADARVLDITDSTNESLGCYINTHDAYLKSESHSSSVTISEDEYVRVTYVIDREEKFGKVYVDGIPTDGFVLTDAKLSNNDILEDFSHNGYIYLNSIKGKGYGSCCIKHLRIYDRALNHNEVITLKISDIEDRKTQRERYNFNFDNKTIPKMYLTFNRANLDSDKNNKIPLTIKYDSPNTDLYGNGFNSSKCYVYAQGTSSLGFVIPNLNVILRDDSGNDMPYNPFKATAKDEILFCLKTNYMDSSNIDNVALAAFANDCLYDENTYNPAQIKDMQDNILDKPNVRHTIAGFPIYVWVKDTSKSNAEFEPYGIYDFNTDRYSANTFGYSQYEDGECLVYEAAANTQTGAAAFNAWTSSSGKTENQYYKDEFRLIHPLSRDGNDDYSEIKRLVNFVSTAGIENFKADLPNYFNVTHLIRYYLFVMVFGLVDSLGKNMKLASFDGGQIWYPQLYDMDTCLGLNNSGLITFDVDIEPEHNANIEDSNVAFNTSASKLWVKLHDFMWDEIKQEYQQLRANKFTLENIMYYIYDKNIALIPETYYAESMQQKYLNFRQDYLVVMHGSRYHHIKKWIKERLLYMDTLMGFDAAINDYVTIRAQAMNEVNIELEPYSPMYIKVKWTNAGDEDSLAYSTVRVRRGETASLSTVLSSNDQEVMIYGGKYIKRLKNLTSLRPKTLLLSAATKLIDLECHSPILSQLAINQCKLLQSVDVSNCISLGTDSTSSQVLDLTGCTNLRYVNAYNTSLQGILSDTTGGNIEEIYYPYSVQTIELYNQNNLKTIGIPTEIIYNQQLNHELNKLPISLNRFKIYNCPNIISIRKEYSDFNYFNTDLFVPLYNVNTIDINNSFDNIDTLNLSYINNTSALGLYNMNNLITLNFNNLTSSENGKLKTIDISGCDNLKIININYDNTKLDKNHYPIFAPNSTMNLSSCFGLIKLSSNYPIKGLTNIILPVSIDENNGNKFSNFKELLFTDEYDTNKKSDITNIYSRYSETRNNIDLPYIELDRIDLETIDIPMELTNLYLNIKNKSDVDINKYRSQDNKINIIGIYDFSDYEESDMVSLFKGINLTNIILKSDNFLNSVNDISSCFEDATISNDTNINEFLSKFNNINNCYRAFKNINGLNIGPSLDTGSVINASEMFYGCNNLISIPEYDLSNLVDGSYMFYDCRKLNIKYDLNLLSCTNANYMFYGCKNLTELNFAQDNEIITAAYMFYNCENLISLQLFNTELIESFLYTFYNCKKLSSIPDLQINSVNDMSYAFYNCKLMTGLADPNKYWLNSNISNYTLCFANCSKLTNFYDEPPEGVPDEWGGLYDNMGEDDMNIKIITNTSSYPVGEYLPSFYSSYKHNLLKINRSAWETYYKNSDDICLVEPIKVEPGDEYELSMPNYQYVTIISVTEDNEYKNTLADSQSVSNLIFTIPDDCTHINILYRTYGSFNIEDYNAKLTDTKIENTQLAYNSISITKIDGSITTDITTPISEVDNIYIKFDPNTTFIDFSRNNYLKSISSIDLSNCPICDYMFQECENLISIDSITLGNAKSLVGTFMGCLNLTTIDSFDTSLIEDISYAFYNCKKLTSIPYLDSEKIKYIDKAFFECSSLKRIDYSTFENVLGMYYTFYNCLSLEFIKILNTAKSKTFERTFYGCNKLMSIEHIDVSSADNTQYMFYNCSSLISNLYLDTRNVTNAYRMFYNCTALKYIAYLDISNAYNVNGLFEGCRGLISIPILNYSNVQDMSRMFSDCVSLKTITLANTSDVENLNRTFYNCRSLTNIIGLNTLNVNNFSYAFYSCISLTDISLNMNNATSLSYAFYNCTALTNLIFENNSNTLNVTNFSYAFAYCTSLLSIPQLDTRSCTNASNIFNGCTNLVNIHLNSWNIDNLKNLSYAIRNCKNLDLSEFNVIENWNMKNITDIEGLLYGTPIQRINVSKWRLENVSNISYLFSNCLNLTTIEGIENLVTSSINNIIHIFEECSSLLELDLSNWDTSNITDLSNVFAGCISLQNVSLEDWDVSNVTNFYLMFGNSGIVSLNLSKWIFSSANNLNCMFLNCNRLISIDINTNYSNIKNMEEIFENCTSLTTIPDTIYIYGIATNAFYNCTSLTEINNVIINCTISNYIFARCENLISINSFIIEDSISASYMFDGCLKLTNIIDFEINTDKDILLNYMFNNCESLTSISGTVSKIVNASYMFNNCENLLTVDFNNWDFSACKNLSYMFYNCYNLRTILKDNGFETSLVENASYVFYRCSNLTIIPFIELDNCKDISGIFYGCTSLQGIKDMQIKTFNTLKVTNMDAAFYNCKELLYFPTLITTVCISMTQTFYNCSKMTGTVNALNYWSKVPAVLAYRSCFYNCTSLTNYISEIPSVWKGGTRSLYSNINNNISLFSNPIQEEGNDKNEATKEELMQELNILYSKIQELNTKINKLS